MQCGEDAITNPKGFHPYRHIHPPINYCTPLGKPECLGCVKHDSHVSLANEGLRQQRSSSPFEAFLAPKCRHAICVAQSYQFSPAHVYAFAAVLWLTCARHVDIKPLVSASRSDKRGEMHLLVFPLLRSYDEGYGGQITRRE
jgi:hypothetical protein